MDRVPAQHHRLNALQEQLCRGVLQNDSPGSQLQRLHDLVFFGRRSQQDDPDWIRL